MTKSDNKLPIILYMMSFAMVAAVAIWISNVPDIRVNQPVFDRAGSEQLEEVLPLPPFVHKATLAGEGGPWNEVFFTPEEMPPPPNCRDLGIEECDWDVRFYDLGEEVEVRVKLKSGQGKTLGETQLVRVQTAEFPELAPLNQAGYRETWLAQVRVMRLLRGRGLGKLMWKAGDAALKITSGGGALRTFVDNNVGWGQSIMKHVPEYLFVWRNPPIWTYWIE